jgi:N-acetylmuramic acid 6-phosphate etherase
LKNKNVKMLDMPPLTDVIGLGTEERNTNSIGFDSKSPLEIARIINTEDQKVAFAIEMALPQIAKAIEAVAKALSNGGRLIYVGTGTSGRLGALDASECPPTFNTDPEMVQYVMAGGEKALARAVEADEDSPALGRHDLAKKKPTRRDVVVGLAASGRTPYTVSAVEYARKKGAATVGIVANPNSPLARAAAIPIVIPVGPEVVAGSTRLKAGTMQKLVLNMITTGAFVRMGYVYDNLMVNLHLKNRKLVERGIGIVQQLMDLDRKSAIEALRVSEGSVPVALVMLEAGVGRKEAEKRLKKSKGNVRKAIG